MLRSGGSWGRARTCAPEGEDDGRDRGAGRACGARDVLSGCLQALCAVGRRRRGRGVGSRRGGCDGDRVARGRTARSLRRGAQDAIDAAGCTCRNRDGDPLIRGDRRARSDGGSGERQGDAGGHREGPDEWLGVRLRPRLEPLWNCRVLRADGARRGHAGLCDDQYRRARGPDLRTSGDVRHEPPGLRRAGRRGTGLHPRHVDHRGAQREARGLRPSRRGAS